MFRLLARMTGMERLSQPKEALQDIEMLKVLIADDDPPTRVLLRAAISQWGYTVIEAKDGEEAWNLLQAVDAPRLLILDWLMPKLDGVDLCRRLKLDSVYRPYIILLTQVAGTANIIKGLEAGADEFLSKPFNMAELRSRLSVGTRIIRFENELAEQNRKLHNYAQSMEALAQERARQLVQHTDMLVMLGLSVLSISKEITDIVPALFDGDPAKMTAEEKAKASDIIKHIRDLHTSLGHTLEVIKSLQADSMHYPHRITSCKINDIIGQVLSICQNLLKNITVTSELAPNLPTLELDPEIIEQALVSIILNISDALKSTTNGTLSIVTKLNDNKIQILFEDSGEQLSESEVSAMFQSILNFDVPYHTANPKRLNIAIAKEIIARYNGKIIAENRPEGGIRFVLELPLQNAARGIVND
jgi:DNA-binding response OmpR family regulator